jgi:hypothetical protein
VTFSFRLQIYYAGTETPGAGKLLEFSVKYRVGIATQDRRISLGDVGSWDNSKEDCWCMQCHSMTVRRQKLKHPNIPSKVS